MVEWDAPARFEATEAVLEHAGERHAKDALEGEVGVGAAAGRRVDDEQHVGDRVDDAAQPRLGRHRVARIALRIGRCLSRQREAQAARQA